MKIRLPADLKDQIEALAKQAGRSMNAEIIHRLQQTLTDGPQSAEAPTRNQIRFGKVSAILQVSNGAVSEISVNELAQAIAAAMESKKLDLT